MKVTLINTEFSAMVQRKMSLVVVVDENSSMLDAQDESYVTKIFYSPAPALWVR
jgi:hypothetical protein